MKPVFKLLALAGVVTIVFACCNQQSKRERHSEQAAPTATEANQSLPPSSSAAVENKKDTSRKFIRTADIKFKVKDVAQATYAIEDIVEEQGGFVTYTTLNSTVNNKTTVAVSADSSLESTYYTVVNSIKLRVPNIKLDTTLKCIARHIGYLDYRTIRADDVALQMLGNKLKQQRLTKHEQRLTNAIDNRGKKLEQVTDAEDNLLNKQEQADDALLSNLSAQDQVSYSTVTLEVYQREAVMRELVSNDKNIAAYTPALGIRLLDAFKSGWQVFAEILVFLTQLWWLILMMFAAYMLYRKYCSNFASR